MADPKDLNPLVDISVHAARGCHRQPHLSVPSGGFARHGGPRSADRPKGRVVERGLGIDRIIYLASAVFFNIALSRGAVADACADAKDAVKDIPTFNECINVCQKGKKTVIADTVQCLPPGCKITLTMSPQSAQAACTLATCQLPRVILDCPSKKFKHAAPLRPSYLLCPMDSEGAEKPPVFGMNHVELGQDLKKDDPTTPMFMADIAVDPGKDYTGTMYTKKLEDIISVPTGMKLFKDSQKCARCHDQPKMSTAKIGDVEALLSLQISPIGIFGGNPPPKGDNPPEELAPYIIDTQDPNLDAMRMDKIKKLKAAGTNLPYKGSDGKVLKPQTLTDICECINADERDGKKIEQQAMDKANLPKNQAATIIRGRQFQPLNKGPFEGVLLKLCNALKDYQTARSCGKDPTPTGNAMACFGVLGGGKFLSQTGAVSELSLDLSGNAEVTNPDSFTFTNFDGGASAFDYLTRTRIDPIIFSSLSATSSANGDVRVTGIGVGTVKGARVNIVLDATSVGGVATFSITDIASGDVLMGGTGEAGLAGLELTSSGP